MIHSLRHTLVLAAAIALSASTANWLRADDPAPQPDASSSATVDGSDSDSSPTTEPSAMPGPGWRHRGFASPDDRFGGPPREWHRGEPLTEDRWKELETFMKANSPRRWEQLQDLSENARERIGRMISRRYDQLQSIKQIDPKVYEIRLKRMKIEDDIFGLGWKLTHGSPEKPETLESKLRQQVTALVHNRLDERRVRISEMQARLAKERELLKHDEANADQAIAAHMKAIEENSKWPQLGDFAGSPPPAGAGHGPRGDRATPPGAPEPSITATVKKAD